MDQSMLSPDENSEAGHVKISPILKSRENTSEVIELKERISRLEEKIRSKDRFIQEIGESKDEDAREFDNQLNKYKAEITQMKAKMDKQMTEAEALRAELDAQRLGRKKLEDELLAKEEAFRAELAEYINRSIGGEPHSFHDINEKALQAQLSSCQKDLRLTLDHNIELKDRMQAMESDHERLNCEMEDLRELNSSLRADISALREHNLELESELHALRANPEMAKQGNSLFGEVIDGREKQEQEMMILFREKERFRSAYDKAMKMLRESTMKAEQNYKRDALTGPTLDVFKKTKKKLKCMQHENERLRERVTNLETDMLNMELKQQGKNSSEIRIQHQIMQDDLRCKKRLEMQINQLQVENHDLLDKIAEENSRAAAVPSLENRIEVLQKIISQLENDRRQEQ